MGTPSFSRPSAEPALPGKRADLSSGGTDYLHTGMWHFPENFILKVYPTGISPATLRPSIGFGLLNASSPIQDFPDFDRIVPVEHTPRPGHKLVLTIVRLQP